MKSILDIYTLYYTYVCLFHGHFSMETGNCKDNNRELLTANNKESLVEVCIFITV